MHLAGSLFDVFRLQRIELNEGKDCSELNAFLKNGSGGGDGPTGCQMVAESRKT
jgi:hypothetical protein